MKDTYVLADTHFGHKNIHKFRMHPNGHAFDSSKEHDEYVMDMWNTYIPGGARVIIAGDVAFNVEGLQKLERLHGDKTIIPGNHDKAITTLVQYCGCVKPMVTASIGGVNIVITHIPIHFSQLERWHVNIHGHTHAQSVPDSVRHFNISLEALGFIPITVDEIIDKMTREVWFGGGDA